MTTEPTRSTTNTNEAEMSNLERAIEVMMDANEGFTEGDVSRMAVALADAGWLMPELPNFGGASYLDVEDLVINTVNTSGNVLIEWESDSDYFYGRQLRSLWLNRDQVLAIIAATNLTEEQK